MKVRRILVTDTAIALIVTLIPVSFGSGWPSIWRTFVVSMVYSHVIGGLGYWIVPRTWPKSLALSAPWNWLLRVGVWLAMALVGTLVSCFILLLFGFATAGAFWSMYWADLRFATLITIVAGMVISVYESMRAQLEHTALELKSKELERERALKLATEARLSSLESRLHPHFLFNTLNSISSLIHDDPARAERLMERMSALLRFSLDSKHNGLVPLEHELQVVYDYLEIEKARFGERLRFDIAVPDELRHINVPPLSLQTLVENSVKYVIAPSRFGGEIRIAGERHGEVLRLAVADSGPGFDLEAALPGHGIDNLRSRLFTLFGNRAAVRTQHRNESGPCNSVVFLDFPQNGALHASFPPR